MATSPRVILERRLAKQYAILLSLNDLGGRSVTLSQLGEHLGVKKGNYDCILEPLWEVTNKNLASHFQGMWDLTPEGEAMVKGVG